MSGHKNKQRNKDQDSLPNRQGGDSQKSGDCDVRIHGAIEVHPPPSLIAEHKTERDEDNTKESRAYVVSLATFWAVAIYGFLTFLLVIVGFWNITIARDTFNASNRPYVGTSGKEVRHQGIDNTNNAFYSDHQMPQTNYLIIGLAIKNFGTVPGTKATIPWKQLIDGKESDMKRVPDKPSTIYPGEIRGIQGVVGPNDYLGVMSGAKILQYQVTVDYEGPSGHYTECTQYQYEPKINNLFNLGACP